MGPTSFRSASAFFRAAARALPAFALAGCAIRPPLAVRPAPPVMISASMDELLVRIAPDGAAIRNLKAAFSASFADPGKGASRSFSGMLAMGRPGKLRMQGSKAMLPILFDLLWDDGAVSLYVPRDRAVYRAADGARAVRRGIPDARLLTGVFLGLREKPGLLHFLETEPSRYLLYSIDVSGSGAALSRRITFDRADLSPVRYEYFDRGGCLAREVRCAGFSTAEGAPLPLPRRVVLLAPGDGARISLRLSDLRVNAPLAAGMFTLETPPGTAVRPLEGYAP